MIGMDFDKKKGVGNAQPPCGLKETIRFFSGDQPRELIT